MTVDDLNMATGSLKDQLERKALDVLSALLDDQDKATRANTAIQFLHVLAMERQRTVNVDGVMQVQEDREPNE